MDAIERELHGRGRILRPRVTKSREFPSAGRICVPRDVYPATPHETRRAIPKQSSRESQNPSSETLIAMNKLRFSVRMLLGSQQTPSRGDFTTLPHGILPGRRSAKRRRRGIPINALPMIGLSIPNKRRHPEFLPIRVERDLRPFALVRTIFLSGRPH